MFIAHPNTILKSFYPSLIWKVDEEDENVFLTFDDGPTPGVTDKLLNLLSAYDARATFFCLGRNIQRYPELFNRISEEGHTIGNHTYSHLNGWRTSTNRYLRNVDQFDKIYHSKYFRPPYGRLKPSQILLLKSNYKIVMWSALSMDYHPNINKQRCYHLATKNLATGSIIVFHDSKKAASKMLFAVEHILKNPDFSNFKFAALGH